MKLTNFTHNYDQLSPNSCIKSLPIWRWLLTLAVFSLGFAHTASATKTAPPLPIQLSVAPTQALPGATVEYLMHLPNKSSSSYWGVSVSVRFPQGVSCTRITAQNRAGCQLSGNTLSCYWKDYPDWWVTDVKVACTVIDTQNCVGAQRATATLSIDKPAQTNSAEATLHVTCPQVKKQCGDGKDNDGDGRIDFPHDLGCTSAEDDDESGEPQCQDGRDNDGDGRVDFPHDPGCSSANDGSEQDDPACSDGRDNDGDGRIDFPQDLGCHAPNDNDEGGEPQCQDGRDNDGDGRVDFPHDPGCSSANDGSEQDDPACSDGRDNDGDGRIDFPQDLGCHAPNDNDEGGEPQCQDGRDNDGDGKIDFPHDPGCSSTNDGSEQDDAACSDGRDNDGDGRTDFPQDRGCQSPSDNDEGGEAQCQDGRDNDGDGKMDFPTDPGCSSADDGSEQDDAACSDGRDNDGDGRVDFPHDPGCNTAADTDEGDEPQCSDLRDNDGDGKIDFPADAGCESARDSSETGEPQCSDGQDNDKDGWIDFPEDAGCSSKHDDSERDPNGPECDNGRDDDGDGRTDFPADSDCTGPKDTSESNQCSDGKDNDRDGKTDFPADRGCRDREDNDESDEPKPECSDWKDNDRDGKTDFPADPGCSSDEDDNEGDEPKPECSDGKDNDHDGWIDFPEDSGCTDAHDDDESNPVNPLTPLVTCVLDNGDHTVTAFFGYENSGQQSIALPAGTNDRVNINILSPQSITQQQPSTFDTGRRDAVFSISMAADAHVTWTLMVNGSEKRSVTAQRGVSRECKPVLPLAECVDDLGGGKFQARFGYDNGNSFEIPIAIGTQNGFSPAPVDRGQPNRFFSGLVQGAFRVDYTGDTLTWTLGGRQATASKSSKPCTPNTTPQCIAGGPYSMSCQGTETIIMLDGSSSRDPEGKSLTYGWKTNCQRSSIESDSSATTRLRLAGPGLGEDVSCGVELTVSDGVLSSSCQASVTVPACSLDCAGKPGGSAQVDQCGVCGGDGSSCLGCDGKPNSGAVPDRCGVCGGNNACLGCDGVPNSGEVADECGVCGGDGSSCRQCTESNIRDTLMSMDTNAQRQEANAHTALRRLQRQAKDKRTKDLAQQGRTEASKLSNQMWILTWSLPQVILSCPEAAGCATSDNSISINSYNDTSRALRDLTQQALRELQRVLGGQLRPEDKKVGVAADRLYEEALGFSGAVPRFQTTCN